jgi:hypothetical protein
MTYYPPIVSVTPDGSHDVITLRRNGRTLDTRRVPVQWSATGHVQAPSRSALDMVREHPDFGENYTVQWEGQGFTVHLSGGLWNTN